jgi:hypothetical protein
MEIRIVQKKLDIFANVAITVVALLIGITLIRQQISHAATAKKLAAAAALESSLDPGKHISPPAGYEWSQHDRTLLMALRYGCVHCEKNMPFYQQMQNQINKSEAKTSLLSIFPDDSFVAQHDLDTHALNGTPFIANVDFAKLHILGTPTLLLVDNKGTILQSWIGELTKDKQDEVMKTLQ